MNDCIAAHTRGDPEIVFASALDQARLIRERVISPVELVTAYLDRIAGLDSAINSFVTVDPDDALARARTAESVCLRSDALPPFMGVPISVKDLSETRGLRTTMSSKAYAEHVPTADSPIVKRLRRAGFIIIGKSNTPEFGSLPVTESDLNGRCCNPWNPQRTSGGSSGGAAAGVAAGLVPIAHGSDGAGSLRIPASCCGVFGFMPTRATMPSSERVNIGPGPVDGVIARTVSDAIALLQVVCIQASPSGPPPGESPDLVKSRHRVLRIAVATRPPIECDVDPECVKATDLAAELLAEAGHELQGVTPDWCDDEIVESFLLVRQTITIAYGDPDDALLDEVNRQLLRMARQTSAADLHRALVRIHVFASRLARLWDTYDALLTPTLARAPVEHGWLFSEPDIAHVFRRAAEFSPFAAIANVMRAPSVSVPLHWSGEGLPIGVQLIAPAHHDLRLASLSLELEQARPWATMRPPVSPGVPTDL